MFALVRPLAIIAVIAVNCGCAVTYPIKSDKTARYVGQTLTVQNRAFLLASDDSQQLEIGTGLINGSHRKVAELPEGTEIQVRSFWRHQRWYLIGGLMTTDYAWVATSSPSTDRVNAKLPTAKFEDIFDSSKYRPNPADQAE